jgi:hypothetical protein
MVTKDEGAKRKVGMADVLRDPEKTFLTQLEEQKEFVLERKTLSQLIKSPVALKAPMMQLSAGQSYDAARGLVDMYRQRRNSNRFFIRLQRHLPGLCPIDTGFPL